MKIIKEIKDERERQIAKWGKQKHPLRVWWWIWMEEVGEYYQAKFEAYVALKQYKRLPSGARFIIYEKWEHRKNEEFVQVLTVLLALVSDWRPWHGFIWE